jgi:hypothetical protein
MHKHVMQSLIMYTRVKFLSRKRAQVCTWVGSPPYGCNDCKNRVTIFLNGQFIIVYHLQTTYKSRVFSSDNHSAYFHFFSSKI